MKRKKLLKAIADLVKRPIVKVGFYIAGMLLVLGLSEDYSDGKSIIESFKNMFLSEDTLSLFFAGLFSLGLAKLLSWFEGYMEESMKTEDNHHKLIAQYHKHKMGPAQCEDSFAAEDGEYLILQHTRQEDMLEKPEPLPANATKKERRAYRKALSRWEKALAERNAVKDKQSKEYKNTRKLAAKYLSGKLCLCSVNVFANVAANTLVRFNDSPEEHELPSFVITHADELLQAHKNSTRSNTNTIRLNDFTYEGNTLTLNTSRSSYYHMLITNRCMDYRFANGLSLRELYEYENKICPMKRSKFGNQIGINGLIVTSDDYILIEKRGRNKITWKNKFAQSISLAMKMDDLGMDRRDVLGYDRQVAEDSFKKIIQKTINSNFGLVPGDYDGFNMQTNFLGVARDLLEGGKPNMYFFVRTNCTAKELQRKLEMNVKVTQADNEGKPKEEEKTVISTSKLDSDYYLVPFQAVQVNFDYQMHLDKAQILKVHRKLAPRCTKLEEWWDKTKETVARICKPMLARECGEALLVTLAYMELRWDWWKTHKGDGNT